MKKSKLESRIFIASVFIGALTVPVSSFAQAVITLKVKTTEKSGHLNLRSKKADGTVGAPARELKNGSIVTVDSSALWSLLNSQGITHETRDEFFKNRDCKNIEASWKKWLVSKRVRTEKGRLEEHAFIPVQAQNAKGKPPTPGFVATDFLLTEGTGWSCQDLFTSVAVHAPSVAESCHFQCIWSSLGAISNLKDAVPALSATMSQEELPAASNLSAVLEKPCDEPSLSRLQTTPTSDDKLIAPVTLVLKPVELPAYKVESLAPAPALSAEEATKPKADELKADESKADAPKADESQNESKLTQEPAGIASTPALSPEKPMEAKLPVILSAPPVMPVVIPAAPAADAAPVKKDDRAPADDAISSKAVDSESKENARLLRRRSYVVVSTRKSDSAVSASGSVDSKKLETKKSTPVKVARTAPTEVPSSERLQTTGLANKTASHNTGSPDDLIVTEEGKPADAPIAVARTNQKHSPTLPSPQAQPLMARSVATTLSPELEKLYSDRLITRVQPVHLIYPKSVIEEGNVSEWVPLNPSDPLPPLKPCHDDAVRLMKTESPSAYAIYQHAEPHSYSRYLKCASPTYGLSNSTHENAHGLVKRENVFRTERKNSSLRITYATLSGNVQTETYFEGPSRSSVIEALQPSERSNGFYDLYLNTRTGSDLSSGNGAYKADAVLDELNSYTWELATKIETQSINQKSALKEKSSYGNTLASLRIAQVYFNQLKKKDLDGFELMKESPKFRSGFAQIWKNAYDQLQRACATLKNPFFDAPQLNPFNSDPRLQSWIFAQDQIDGVKSMISSELDAKYFAPIPGCPIEPAE